MKDIIDSINYTESYFNNIVDLKNVKKYEQFYTPKKVADYMSKMFCINYKKSINVLDAGCGIGILAMSLIEEIVKSGKVETINLTLCEIDELIISYLKKNMENLKIMCSKNGVNLNYNIKNDDFIGESIKILKQDNYKIYDYVIMNPPYKKMNNKSTHKNDLKEINIDVSNYYSAFVILGSKLLKYRGQIVAITPRSFCNGNYFHEFRRELLNIVYFDKIHIFESRNLSFENEKILQETIIYHCIKGKPKSNSRVTIFHSNDLRLIDIRKEYVNYYDLIYGDKLVIRIHKSIEDKDIINKMMSLKYTLDDININVSTGPIVDFRENENSLSNNRCKTSNPIIYPEHIIDGEIRWPLKSIKKFNYILNDIKNANRLRKNDNYVLVKRMTSKEESKRIVSVLYTRKGKSKFVGFDNKLNYYHINKLGMPIEIAKGLCIYLNSTFVDLYFRMISGSTQVNVSDLRNIRYPSENQLVELSKCYKIKLPKQETIDRYINDILFEKDLNNIF